MTPAEARAVLGLSAASSPAETKEAWRRHAQAHHPDRGGSQVAFQEGRRAYEVLRNAAPLRCTPCLGTGYINKEQGFYQLRVRCGTCGGTGRVI